MAWDGAACCSAGALEPPENQPPMAWPMDDPTATPLYKYHVSSRGQIFIGRSPDFWGIVDLRSGRCHLAEKTGSLALDRHGRSLLGSRGMSGGRVRCALLLLRSSRSRRSSSRTGGSAARRGGRTTTTALTRHSDECV